MPRPVNPDDLIGKKINKLTIISLNRVEKCSDRIEHFYNCLCDCGKEVVKRRRVMIRKKDADKSCGCYRRISCRENSKISAEKRWLGGNEKAKRTVFQYYQNNAKRRNHEFSLDKETFYKLVESNCIYCNKPPSSIQKVYRSKIDRVYESYTYNGIDRVDSKLGYTKENSVTCCETCNRMKLDHTKDDFLNHIKKVYENLKL